MEIVSRNATCFRAKSEQQLDISTGLANALSQITSSPKTYEPSPTKGAAFSNVYKDGTGSASYSVQPCCRQSANVDARRNPKDGNKAGVAPGMGLCHRFDMIFHGAAFQLTSFHGAGSDVLYPCAWVRFAFLFFEIE